MKSKKLLLNILYIIGGSAVGVFAGLQMQKIIRRMVTQPNITPYTNVDIQNNWVLVVMTILMLVGIVVASYYLGQRMSKSIEL